MKIIAAREFLILIFFGLTVLSAKSDQISIHFDIEISAMPLSQVCEEVSSRMLDQFGAAPKIKIISNPEQFQEWKPQVLPKPKKIVDFAQTPVTLKVENVDFATLLHLLSKEVNGVCIQSKNEVIMHPDNGTFVEFDKKVYWGVKKQSNSEKVDYRQVLAEAGMRFYEGSHALYYPGSGKLVVYNSKRELDSFDGSLLPIKDRFGF